jgi:hypothetical protein
MLGIFRWVVRFFDGLRALDDRFEANWRNNGWPERLKWWLGGSAAISAFAFLLVCSVGVVLLEANRLIQFVKTGSYPGAAAMYTGLLAFAVGLAAVALTIAFVSCPLFMIQMRHRGK